MATRRHADTETPLEGFEGRIQAAFEWIGAHPKEFLAVLGGLLLVGGIVAVGYEIRRERRDAAAAELAAIESRFAEAIGGTRAVTLAPEPANPEQAERSREEALTALDGFVEERPGSRAADFARLRAAEMAADLGRYPEAAERLVALIDDLGWDDALRGVALRFLGYTLEEQERDAEAAEAYVAAAEVESYPDPAALWLAAAEAFLRAGDRARAGDAYSHAVSADPAWTMTQQRQDLGALLQATPEDPAEPESEVPPGS